MQVKAVRLFCAIGVLIATFAWIISCGNGEPPAGEGGGGPSGPPLSDGACTGAHPGCACSQAGATANCGSVVSTNGGFTTCSQGTMTCQGDTWGPCIGNQIAQKSKLSVKLTSEGLHEYIPQYTSGNCTDDADLCDPNPGCTVGVGGSGDVDASGVYPAEAGGVSLEPYDAAIYFGTDAAVCGDAAADGGLLCLAMTQGCADGGTTSLTGVVTDPAGVNPLYGITVYIPLSTSYNPFTAQPATAGVTCSSTCEPLTTAQVLSSATTGPDGGFTLTNVPYGVNLPLVLQAGKWRREIQLTTTAVGAHCGTNTFSSSMCTGAGGGDAGACQLRLPRSRQDGYNPATGSYGYAEMPQMALVSGSADPLECVLMKAGISTSEISSYDVNPNAALHFFQSDNAPGSRLDTHFGNQVKGSILWVGDAGTYSPATQPGTYNYYDVVLLPCEGSAIDKDNLLRGTAGQNTNPYQNLINYTDLGGRLFTTHFGYVWFEYPSENSYGTGTNVSSNDNWKNVATWMRQQGTIDTEDPMAVYVITDGGSNYLGGTTTSAKAQAYQTWLYDVGASSTLGMIEVSQARQDLTATGPYTQAWMSATDNYDYNSVYPPHFTFNTPYDAGANQANQCGYVVYSDFHVAASALVSTTSTRCQENSQCGYGQVCDGGSIGAAGSCSEPCEVNSDCHSGYTCVGATAGTCQPIACNLGGYYCPGGGTCSPSGATGECYCSNDTQCASLHCVNSSGLCSGGSCTGDAAAGETAFNCQSDSVVQCNGVATFLCQDSHYTCTSDSGVCPGVPTGGTIGVPTVDAGIGKIIDAGPGPWGPRSVGSTCGPSTTTTSPEFYAGSASAPTVDGGHAVNQSTSGTVTIGYGGTPAPVPSLVSIVATNTNSNNIYVQYNGSAQSQGSNADCTLYNNNYTCVLALLTSTDYITIYTGGDNSVQYTLDIASCPSGKVLAVDQVASALASSSTTPLNCGSGSNSGYPCDSQSQTHDRCTTGGAANADCPYSYSSTTSKFPSYCYGCNTTCAGSGGACDTAYSDAGGGTCCEYNACPLGYDAGAPVATDCRGYVCDAGTLDGGPNTPTPNNTWTAPYYPGGCSTGGGYVCNSSGSPWANQTFPVGDTVVFDVLAEGSNAYLYVYDNNPAVNNWICWSTSNGSSAHNTCVITSNGDPLSFYSQGGYGSTQQWTITDYPPCASNAPLQINGASQTMPYSSSSASYTGATTVTCNAPYQCYVPADAGFTCASGVANDAGTECLCTADNQCPTGVCNFWSATVCDAGACTGDGGLGSDVHNCSATSPTCSMTSDVFTCGLAGGGGCIDAGTFGHENCRCNSDTECTATGSKCATWSGCDGGACTGSAAATTNDFGCTLPSTPIAALVACTPSTYSCSAPAACNDAGTYCWCTQDNQCPTGQCINWAGCDGGCSGTASQPADLANCVAQTDAGMACSSNANCGTASTQVEFCAGVGDGGSGLGQCSKSCSGSGTCPGGETCVDGGCTGCTTASQCSDLTYPVSCSSTSASWGTCCDNWSGGSCTMSQTLFPEACLQAPMTAQEKALEFMFFDLTTCVQPTAVDAGTGGTPPSTLLNPETFYLDFQATNCAIGTQARWREFEYQALFPSPVNGSSITFAAQTGQIGADAGSFVPTTPLPLLTTSTTITGSTWGALYLDTYPGGDGGFTVDNIRSQDDLRIWITLTPTSNQYYSPTLQAWQVIYDCPPTE